MIKEVNPLKKALLDYLMISLGVFIVALSINLFMVPNNFVVGGISGLAIIFNALIPQLEVGLIMVFLDIILFSLGFFTIGAHFGARTLYSSFLLSGLVWLIDLLFPVTEPLIEDQFIQLLLCIVISALGMAIVFRHNASTGGTDITAKILNKYLGIDLGKGVLLSDIVVTLLAFSTFNLTTVLYGLVGIFLNGLIIDFVLDKFKERKEIRIITDDHHEIRRFIIDTLEKGATIYTGYGAYTNNEKLIITTILNQKEYLKLKKFIAEHRINAFITVTSINQTFGLGFEALFEEN